MIRKPNHTLELTSPRAGARGSLAQLERWAVEDYV